MEPAVGWEVGVRSSEETGLGVSTVLLIKLSPTSADSSSYEVGKNKKRIIDCTTVYVYIKGFLLLP